MDIKWIVLGKTNVRISSIDVFCFDEEKGECEFMINGIPWKHKMNLAEYNQMIECFRIISPTKGEINDYGL